MADSLHQDCYDKGLEQVALLANWSGGTLHGVLCKGAPTSRAEAFNDTGNGGKRVSTLRAMTGAEVVLGSRVGGGREITFAAKAGGSTVSVTTVGGDDLHYAFFDGARLLVVLNEPSNQALTANNPIDWPELKIGFGA